MSSCNAMCHFPLAAASPSRTGHAAKHVQEWLDKPFKPSSPQAYVASVQRTEKSPVRENPIAQPTRSPATVLVPKTTNTCAIESQLFCSIRVIMQMVLMLFLIFCCWQLSLRQHSVNFFFFFYFLLKTDRICNLIINKLVIVNRYCVLLVPGKFE